MPTAKLRVTFPRDVQTVWNTVTSLTDTAWRKDLRKVEVLSETQFVEYTKDNFATTFTITASEPCRRWAFDMENANMTGHWTGVFSEENGETTVDFTETITAKRLWMKPFVGSYLKKQQAAYVEDLKKALETGK